MVSWNEENKSNRSAELRDAWNALKSMSKAQASQEYIGRVMDIKERNNIENQVRETPAYLRFLLLTFFVAIEIN